MSLDERPTLRRLLEPHAGALALAFAAMLVEGAAGLAEPWPLKVVFDHVLGSKPPPRWLAGWLPDARDAHAVLASAAAAVVAIAVVGALGSYSEKALSTAVGTRVAHDLRRLLFHHMQRLSLSFYDRQRTGDMVVRLTTDIEAVESCITTAALGIVLDGLTIVGMLAVMLSIDWRFSLIGLSIAPVLFVLVQRLAYRIKAAARAVKRQESDLASVVQESIASARVVKAMAREDFEERRVDRESAAGVDLVLRARRVKALLSPLVDIVVAVGTALVLWYGVRRVLDGRLTAGALLVFVLYLERMYKPMKDLSKMTDTLSKAAVALDRVGEILAVESRVRDLPGARPAPAFAGRIEFARVCFAYAPDEPVLTDVSFVVEPGQHAALVGLSGSGKSTVLSLVTRLYDPVGGEIRVDGADVRSYTLASLREQVGVVLQDPVLFRVSIAENIAYGRPGATRDEIVRAAKLAQADGFIERMPQGYDTVVGERGDTLSGGQRQRIAIARAIVRDPPLLLLDEPSASLDPESEALIFSALRRVMAGRTSITIAHRLATVQGADVILVLSDGRIGERGTHEELLAARGVYARLHATQFRPASRAPGRLAARSA